MTHQETLTRIKEALDSDMSEWDKIVRIRKVANASYKEEDKATPRCSINKIATQIEEHTGITVEQMNKKTRSGDILLARQLAHYKARDQTIESLSSIAFYFGRLTHCSVINSINSIKNQLATDRKFRAKHESFLLQ